MIDGFKATLTGITADYISPLILFNVVRTQTKGNYIITTHTGKYNNLIFANTHVIYKNTGEVKQLPLTVRGSLHKYYKRSDSNADEFTPSQVVEAINRLCHELRVEPSQVKLNALEIGVNVHLPINPNDIINTLHSYKTKHFEPMQKQGVTFGKIVDFTDYEIKIYNKSFQEGIKRNLLRFEVGVKTSRKLRAHGLQTFDDVLKLATTTNVPPFNNMLANIVDEIVMFNPLLNVDNLTVTERKTWCNLLAFDWIATDGTKRAKRAKKRQQLDRFILKHSKTNCKALLKACISEDLNSIKELEKMLICLKSQAHTPTKGGTFAGVDKRGKQFHNTEQKRYCKTCGRDISEQKAGSLFCSEKHFGKEAKKCRNKDSNNRLSKKRKLNSANKKNCNIIATYTINNKPCKVQTNPLNIDIDGNLWIDKITRIEIVKKACVCP